jgi:hypothetical protein
MNTLSNQKPKTPKIILTNTTNNFQICKKRVMASRPVFQSNILVTSFLKCDFVITQKKNAKNSPLIFSLSTSFA